MAGLIPTVTQSKLFAFLFFVIVVWIAVDLGYVLVGVAPQLPAQLKTLMAPGSAAADSTTSL